MYKVIFTRVIVCRRYSIVKLYLFIRIMSAYLFLFQNLYFIKENLLGETRSFENTFFIYVHCTTYRFPKTTNNTYDFLIFNAPLSKSNVSLKVVQSK